jgi:precorrin-2 dehydrogenase / sirohydrochlorin ferrochelatase
VNQGPVTIDEPSVQGGNPLKLYPVMMNLQGRRVVVVGGGRVAERKIRGLLDTGAFIAVISPEIQPELEKLALQNRIHWIREPFHTALLDQFSEIALIFGATDSLEASREIQEACQDKRIPCNIADVPELCSFVVPAVITQGDLMIAISTGGASPALARRIREDLERRFGPEYAEMTRVMGELRKRVLRGSSSSDENKRLFLEIVDSEVLTALRANDREKVVSILKAILPEDIDPQTAVESDPST